MSDKEMNIEGLSGDRSGGMGRSAPARNTRQPDRDADMRDDCSGCLTGLEATIARALGSLYIRDALRSVHWSVGVVCPTGQCA